MLASSHNLFSTSVHDDFFNTARWRQFIQPVSCFITSNLPICPPSGDPVGSDTASSGSRPRQREDAPGARLDARGPRQGPKPWDDGSQREPHGGRPQTQSPGYPGGHSGGEGGADASLCGEDGADYFCGS